MRVLFLSRYIYEDKMEEFTKNRTGFGMMISDIAKSVSDLDEVYLLTRVITKGKNKKINIIRHTWKDVLKSFSVKNLIKGIKKAINSNKSVLNKIKQTYFYLDNGYNKDIIKKINPDLVHIHGICTSSETYIELCEELNIPYIVTLHGLIGLDDSVSASKYNKQLEKKILLKSEQENIPITVISSGIKKRIVKNYGISGRNIKVIMNGTCIKNDKEIKIDIRKKYDIPDKNKLILCIGNISNRKNQIQIVNAYDKLESTLKDNITILFLGKGGLDGKIEKKINELSYNKNLILCGFVKKKNLSSYLTESDLNIVASKDEGFGLAIIESFVYGIPTVTFSDLDAIEDLYDKKAMLLVDERSDRALADGIKEALSKKWDRNWIERYSQKFSLENMAVKYHNYYSKVLERDD